MKKKLIHTYDDFLESKYAFLILNISGWFLYWIFRQILIFSIYQLNTKFLINSSISIFSGFIASFVLRQFYKKINATTLSDFKLWITIFVLTILHTMLWFVIDFLIYSQTMSTFEQLVDWLTLGIFVQQVALNSFVLMVWSFLYFIIKIRYSWKQLSERKMIAELQAKNLEIQMLRYQLNPHFLFNSLNSIRALTLKDIKRSREMISELSEFLRYSLVNGNNTDITLQEEIEAVKHFCAIEKIRFQGKLDIQFSIGPETKTLLLPPLILHPLVENAIKFGMETCKENLRVEINSFISEKKLVLEITNTGKWINEDERKKCYVPGTNTGLENVKQVLSNSFAEKHNFEIITDDGLVKIRITIDTGGEVLNG